MIKRYIASCSQHLHLLLCADDPVHHEEQGDGNRVQRTGCRQQGQDKVTATESRELKLAGAG